MAEEWTMERVERELLRAAVVFEQKHGRPPDPGSRADVVELWKLTGISFDQLPKELRVEMLLPVVEEVAHRLVLDGELEFGGVNEEGESTYRRSREEGADG